MIVFVALTPSGRPPIVSGIASAKPPKRSATTRILTCPPRLSVRASALWADRGSTATSDSRKPGAVGAGWGGDAGSTYGAVVSVRREADACPPLELASA